LVQNEIFTSVANIDISTLPGGIYIVKVVGEEGVRVGRFIKQ